MEYYRIVICKDLHVDNNIRFDSGAYQREEKENRIKKIAAEWDDMLANPLVLSERADGSLWILDGNHTRLACMRVYGEESASLPARIYTGLTRQDEASIFTKLNTSQKKPSFNELLKAKLAANDEFTVQYFNALKAANLKYGFYKNGGSFRAHRSLMNVFKTTSSEMFIRAVKDAVSASADRDEFFQVGIFPGFCTVVIDFPNIDEERLITVTQRTPIGKIINIADTYHSGAVAAGGSNATTWYRNAFIDLYNAKLRKNRIEK